MKAAKVTIMSAAVLALLFVLMPAAPVDSRVFVDPFGPGVTTSDYMNRPEKSGLRIAVERCLRWLGL
jgi:hypothetical protein